MTFLLSNRALLRGMLAGAVVLTGTACSRSDRTESGSDTTAAVLPDTSGSAAQSNTPPVETATPSDNDAAGYRPMERDTTNVPSQAADSALPDSSISGIPESTDTAAIDAPAEVADTTSTEMAGVTDTTVTADVHADTAAAGADTTAAGYVEMARDTSTVADQADTGVAASGDVALETTVDTSSRDSAEVSAEIPYEAADETADEQIVAPEDRETVATSETPTDEVGAAAISGDVTGAEAVALVGREGVRCALVDPEVNEAVRWDMSSTPVALNPCGMGSMNLSRIWAAK